MHQYYQMGDKYAPILSSETKMQQYYQEGVEFQVFELLARSSFYQKKCIVPKLMHSIIEKKPCHQH